MYEASEGDSTLKINTRNAKGRYDHSLLTLDLHRLGAGRGEEFVGGSSTHYCLPEQIHIPIYAGHGNATLNHTHYTVGLFLIASV